MVKLINNLLGFLSYKSSMNIILLQIAHESFFRNAQEWQ